MYMYVEDVSIFLCMWIQDNVMEAEISVDPRFHRHFVARRGEVLRQIAEEYGGVTVSFPRSGVKSDKVVLKGARDCVEGAKRRIIGIVEDLESQVGLLIGCICIRELVTTFTLLCVCYLLLLQTLLVYIYITCTQRRIHCYPEEPNHHVDCSN